MDGLPAVPGGLYGRGPLTRDGVPSPGLVRAAPVDHPPAPHPHAGGRRPQAPPLRQGLGTLRDNDRGAWTRGGGSAYTPPGLVVSCGVGISVVSVRVRWCLYPTRVIVTFSWCRFEIVGIGYIVSIGGVVCIGDVVYIRYGRYIRYYRRPRRPVSVCRWPRRPGVEFSMRFVYPLRGPDGQGTTHIMHTKDAASCPGCEV